MLKNFKHLLLAGGLTCLFLLILSVSLVGQSGYLNLDVSITHPTSCAVKDGTIIITPLNGTPPYQYSLNGGATFTTNSTISNLGIGSYVISVKDAENHLSSFQFVQLVVPNGPRVEGVSVEHPTKCGEGGKIIITANGAPREPLWYSIDGGATYLDETWFQNLGIGSYNIVVANQDTTCLATYPTFEFNPIEPSQFISGSVNATTPTCANSDGSIEVIVAGNKNDYEFSIDRGITFQKDNVFSNLGEGNYSVVVKQVEQNCQKEIEIVVFDIAGCPPVPCDALLQNASLEITDCADIATYCLNLPFSDLNEYLISVNDQPYTDLLHLCDDNGAYAAIQLAIGTHFINITSLSGLCNVSANVSVTCLYDGSKDCELLADEVAILATYNATYDYCLNIPLAELEAYDISVNGHPYTQELAACQSDNNLAALLFNQGTYYIILAAKNGFCSDTATVRVTSPFDPDNPDYCNSLLTDQVIELVNHNDKHSFCLNIPYTALSQYEIMINGQPANQQMLVCGEDTDLAAIYVGKGTYFISITHENGTCSNSATFRVTCPYDPTEEDYCSNLLADQTIDLGDDLEGTFDLCLNIPLTALSEYTILVNGHPATQQSVVCSENNSLAGLILERGLYFIEITHENGTCKDNATIRVTGQYDPNEPEYCKNLITDEVIEIARFDDRSSYCLGIPYATLGEYVITINGQPLTQELVICSENNDLIGVYLGQGVYQISITHENGICNDTATVRITSPFDPDDPIFCANIIENEVIEIGAGEENSSFCLNIPIATAPSYTITINGQVPTQDRLACSGDTSLLAIYLERGTHFIELVHENGTCTDNATIVVRSKFDPTNPTFCAGLIEDDRIALDLFSDKQPYCLNIPLSELSQFTIKINGFAPTQEIVPCPSDASLAALVFERGTYQIDIEHSNGICKDFANVEFYAPYNPDDPDYCATLIKDTVLELERFGDQHYYCLNIPAANIDDFDIKVNGKIPNQQTLVCREDTTLIGLLFQKGTYLVTLDHKNGVCNDSATVSVTCPFDPTNPDFCENLLENKVYELTEPAGTMPLCLNIPLAALSEYEITVNGHPPTQDILACNADTTLLALEFTEGTYYITIQHENGLCSDEATVRFDAPTNWEDSTLCSTLISNATFTVADTNDLIPFCLNIPLADMDNFVLTLSGSSVNQNIVACEADTLLAALYLGIGLYDISINHLNGVCSDEATVLVNPPFDPTDSLSCNNLIGDSVFKLTTIGETHPFCLNIPLTQVPSFNITINGNSLLQIPIACASNASMAAVRLPEGVHIIELNHRTGTCTDKATIRILNPDSMDSLDCNALIENGAYELIDSGGVFRYCVNIPQNEINNFTLQVNKEGINATPILVDCAQNPNLVALALQQGLYTVYLNHNNGMCSDSATIKIDNPTDEQAELDQDCIGFLRSNEILELTDCDTLATYCLNLPLTSSNTLQLSVDGIITNDLIPCTATGNLGIQLGRGMHTLVLSSDSSTCVDTGSVFVRCLPPELLQITDTLQFNQKDTFCIDTMLLPGKITSISNECPENSGTIVDFVVDTTTLCVIYSSKEITGQEEACIVICNEAGDCGTINLTVTVVPEPAVDFADTIGLNTFDIHCIDTSQLAGTIVSIENICPESSGEAVIFTVNTASYCVTYTGMEAGTEKACIRMCDDTGQCFVTEFTITVEDDRLSYQDTIAPNTTAIYCVDPTLLPGRLISIRNTCPEAAGTAAGIIADFSIDTSSYCVTYTGLIPGTAKACIEICNSSGVCTTINMTIVVEEPEDTLQTPIAVADRDSTLAGAVLVLNVLKNDTLFAGDSINVTIVAVPPNGTTFVNPDGTISYMPNNGFCDDEDVFMYQVCTPAGCDTARVYIYVTCTMIEIFPAFSPNGDGINDTFIINGLGGFPNHVLQIYDRRGTRVLLAEKYQNDWDGTWQGRDLPDGIYYYVLEDGIGGHYDGYLQIRR